MKRKPGQGMSVLSNPSHFLGLAFLIPQITEDWNFYLFSDTNTTSRWNFNETSSPT